MSGGGVPANTSSTTTVNQSPWQNKTYRTLALGTPENLGPVAQQLKIGQQLTQDWMDIQSGRNPGLYYGMPNATPQELAAAKAGQNVGFAAGRAPAPAAPAAAAASTPTPADTPTATAAQGGIMSLQNFASGGLAKAAVNPQAYAPGGKVTPKYNTKSSADDKLTALQDAVKNNYKPKPAEVKFMQTMADNQDAIKALGSDTPYTIDPKTGGIKPSARGANQSSADYTAYLNKFGAAGASIDPKLAKQYGAQTAAQVKQTATDKETASNRPFSYSDLATPTAFLDPKTGQNMLADAQLAYQKARELGTPQEIDQASKAYNNAISNLERMANYQAKDVSGKDAQAAAMQAASMQGREAKAAQVSRGDVRDINAIMADVERYQAAGMQAPAALQAEAYQAAQMQGAKLEGPKSWTDAGTAQKYMSPYQQAVTNQDLFEANRQAQMRENQQRSQATQQKAFGGTRAALQESEGRRNLGYLLADIQNKGSQQAYTQGMQQFSAEQGLGLQAGQSNLQAALTTQQQNQAALNQQRSLYVQQALDAAKTSYGGELTAAQANQVAANAASQFNAGAQNQAYNNYSAQQLAAQQANQSMDWNVANQNAQLAQQAELANQQYGLGGFQSNLQNAQFTQGANQLNAQNQQATNLANQLYGVGGYNAQAANQQAGLQANQQNLGAWGQVGNMAQGLGNLGTSRNQIELNNLGALGQSATAQTNYAQGALDRQTNNALNYVNLPSTFNAAGINALNAQPVSGGTNTSNQWYNQAKPFAKGGKVKWGPKK